MAKGTGDMVQVRLMGPTIEMVEEAVEILKKQLNQKDTGVMYVEQKTPFVGEKGDKLSYGMILFLPK